MGATGFGCGVRRHPAPWPACPRARLCMANVLWKRPAAAGRAVVRPLVYAPSGHVRPRSANYPTGGGVPCARPADTMPRLPQGQPCGKHDVDIGVDEHGAVGDPHRAHRLARVHAGIARPRILRDHAPERVLDDPRKRPLHAAAPLQSPRISSPQRHAGFRVSRGHEWPLKGKRREEALPCP